VSTLEKLVGAAVKRPAPRTFDLLPEYFAETWGNRPTATFKVGLRVPGEQEYLNAVVEAENAQSEAVEKALKDPKQVARAQALGVAAYNKRLVMFCVARGICNQHNVTLPHPYFELPEDEIPVALKSTAIRRIFDEIERLAVDQSPVFAEATEVELFELAEILATDDPFEDVPSVQRARCLRYLKLVLDTLRE
jgi:hypothetical protein